MRNYKLGILIAGFLAAGGVGFASSISVAGQISVLPSAPPSVVHGAIVNDQTGFVFFEDEVVLFSPLTVDISSPGTYASTTTLTPGVIDAGTTVDSYFFEDEPASMPATGYSTFTGSITFPTQILGIIINTTNLAVSDPPLGAPGTAYPSAADIYSGLELNVPGCSGATCGNDAIVLSADRKTVTIFSVVNTDEEDDVRILVSSSQAQTSTPVPEPSGAVLAGLGLLFVIIIQAHKNGRKTKSVWRKA